MGAFRAGASGHAGHAQLVNFFGHATVACWYRAEPSFVLGAMLPDFVTMLRLSAPTLHDPALRGGVTLHHATDAAFHDIPSFVLLTRTAQARLNEAGLARGPARAVAHVGVELLLDEVLASDAVSRAGYLDALHHARAEPGTIAWSSSDAEGRFAELIGALSTRGAVSERSTPEKVARRLRAALANRPRLALGEDDEPRVRDWVVAARPSVVGCASLILSELRIRLDLAGFQADAPRSGR